jgi:4-oxalocrotonate tautomerase
MPIVEVYLWEGRDKDTKKKLVEKVTDAVVDVIKCPKEAVTVLISESPKDNWGLGGKLASEKFPEK